MSPHANSLRNLNGRFSPPFHGLFMASVVRKARIYNWLHSQTTGTPEKVKACVRSVFIVLVA